MTRSWFLLLVFLIAVDIVVVVIESAIALLCVSCEFLSVCSLKHDRVLDLGFGLRVS